LRANRNPTYERWRWQIFSVTWLAYAALILPARLFFRCEKELRNRVGALRDVNHVQDRWRELVCLCAWGYSFCSELWGNKLAQCHVLVGMLASVIPAIAMGRFGSYLDGPFVCVARICHPAVGAAIPKRRRLFFRIRERGSIMGFWCASIRRSGASWLPSCRLRAQKLGWRSCVFVLRLPFRIVYCFSSSFIQRIAIAPRIWVCRRSNSTTEKRKRSLTRGHARSGTEGSWHVVAKSCAIGWFGSGDSYFLIKPRDTVFLFFFLFCFTVAALRNDLLGTGRRRRIPVQHFRSAGPWGAGWRIYSDRPCKSKRIPSCVIAFSASSICLAAFRLFRRRRLEVVSVGCLAFNLYPGCISPGAASN